MSWLKLIRPQPVEEFSRLEPDRFNRTDREWITVNGLTVLIHRLPYRRNIKAIVELNGDIRLSAPRSAKVHQLIPYIQSWVPWITQSLAKGDELRVRYPIKSYKKGEEFLLYGECHRLHFVRGEDERRIWATGGLLVIEVPHREWNETYLWAPQSQSAQWLRDFYKAEAQRVFPQITEHWSQRLQLMPKKIRVRGQMSLWGSCTSSGNISLNWKLIGAPRDVIDYVIIHELCHLKHMDHSRHFWKLVESQCPSYRESRKWLREHHYAFDFLNKHSVLYVSKL